MFFITFWNKYKKQFVYGEDYIDVDCGDYIAICPSVYEVIGNFPVELRLYHCLTRSTTQFKNYFNSHVFKPLYGDYVDMIKVFFFKKRKSTNKIIKELDPLNEFTGWIPNGEKNSFLYFFHNIENQPCLIDDGKSVTYERFIYSNRDTCIYLFNQTKYASLVCPYIEKIIKEFNKNKYKLRLKSYLFIYGDSTEKGFKKTNYYKKYIKQ